MSLQQERKLRKLQQLYTNLPRDKLRSLAYYTKSNVCRIIVQASLNIAQILCRSEILKALLEASGKLQLLDKFMVKFRERGHRVLIYSQFTSLLDILEDWLNERSWGYKRIDGTVGKTSKFSSTVCFTLHYLGMTNCFGYIQSECLINATSIIISKFIKKLFKKGISRGNIRFWYIF